MHLLAAKPGGFVDDEGIIDLEQNPADIVILSAADSTLAALSSALQGWPIDQAVEPPSVRLANWMQLLKPAAYDLYEHKVLEHAALVVVSLLGGESYWRYGLERLEAWQAAQPLKRTLIVVPGDDAPDPDLFAKCSVSLEDSQRVWRYLREGGVNNSQHLLNFLAAQYFNLECEWREPNALPKCSIYMPREIRNSLYPQTAAEGSSIDFSNFSGQASFAEWEKRWEKRWCQLSNEQKESEPQQEAKSKNTVLLLFYRSHLQSANTAMFDALIGILEQHNIQPLPVAIASLKDKESLALVNALIEQSSAGLIINTTSFATNTVASPELSSQPTDFLSPFMTVSAGTHAKTKRLPVLQLLLSGSTEEDWQEHKQGLRSRDIAMQVVLPEMDGRIVTRTVSFKAESHFDTRGECAIVRYALHTERAHFVAQLAAGYLKLANKANSDKRLALILANYPTKDGRIGNGVGLDTPNSTVNILSAMASAGYPTSNIPEHGNALIEALLGSVTNNPNTLHELPCWQSLALDDYRQYFSQLPELSQQAVLERWGPPEQDIKCRQGRLMISGMRLGETFVGIQPARGFNIDLLANYHDPDLIPPHNYLAFYFWLRHCYQVDAVVHVGKHGNLEWLPGKGLALSEECWPDITLGPMPHFYPFIVNDPGEGAQAKRRAQAVIIDHLMPPMTRAETYGELAELETLVDEYYQAMGMDDKREQWLRVAILKQVNSQHLREELSLSESAQDDEVLADLDAYLCDIKEAQIRHGLHILGQLPASDKLADTIVALLRLPRGTSVQSQGILHNLAQDLDLGKGSSEISFDPLDTSTEVWGGPKPQLLIDQSDDLWRTHADTRERLELLALTLVRSLLDESKTKTIELIDLPRTAEQMIYARDVIKRALDQSAEMEIRALMNGLEGHFVEPGPSGAPTRGRLDTLPTGRNFFSVDNRAIPSPAAWAIGQRSAQAMLERHLQSHGDYPKQLALSVWGTATMRTGGDDIAQAFALMGVEPIWATGSSRVIDFKVIGTQMLGRPRVDVTLRVSGFFRDAFPNVMKLFDAAVQAISEIEEPGNQNIIQQNIRRRAKALEAEGLSAAEAHRQASYRVFGSKPGAYGAGLQGLIDERCWEKKSDLAEAFLNWGGYAYGQNDSLGQSQQDGVAAKAAFQYQLSQVEVVAHNQDNREHDILDSDDYYQFQGGLSNAVEVYGGVAPVVYHNDHSNPSQPKTRTLKEELNRVIRSRLLNPKWIKGMREHGYKGAFEMAASVDYMFAYDATTNLIDDYQYAMVSDALIFDAENLAFLKENNPNGIIKEFPLLVTKFMGKKIPAAGGFYLRTLPTKIIKNAIKDYEKENIPATLYIHSWELTPQYMPRISMSKMDYFITYHNLQKAFTKTNQLIQEFEFTSFEKFLENNLIS